MSRHSASLAIDLGSDAVDPPESTRIIAREDLGLYAIVDAIGGGAPSLVLDLVQAALEDAAAVETDSATARARFEAAFLRAEDELRSRVEEAAMRGAAVVAGVLMRDRSEVVAFGAGDLRSLVVRDGRVQHRAPRHTLREHYARMGLDVRASDVPKGVLVRAFGLGTGLDTEVIGRIEPGDSVLLTTVPEEVRTDAQLAEIVGRAATPDALGEVMKVLGESWLWLRGRSD